MLGICPNCKISLKKPPFNNRETNEVLLTLKYRSKRDSNQQIKSIDDLGYCEICNAKEEDMKEQGSLE